MASQKQSLPSFASILSLLSIVFYCAGLLRVELELNEQKKRINALENIEETTPSYVPNLNQLAKKTRGALSSSSILGNLESTYFGRLNSYLFPVLQSPDRSRFVRCWHAKTDGWAASTFHSNCDGKGPTVTIVQVGSYIFGGYTDKSWGGSCRYVYSSKSFLFSLYNINGYAPVKVNIKSSDYSYAIYTCSNYGPTFARGHYLYISSNAASNRNSQTYCGYSYPLPLGYSASFSSCRFYAGSYKFTPTDVEVFYETTT